MDSCLSLRTAGSAPGSQIVAPRDYQRIADEKLVYPKLGAYVVVSLDVRATFGTISHPHLLARYHDLKDKKYLALIESVDVSKDKMPFQYVTLRFLFQGETPLSSAPDGITSAMTVPVGRNGCQSSPRRPLAPSPPLPWDRLYHSSFVSARVYCGGFGRSHVKHRVCLDARDLSYYRFHVLSDVRENDRLAMPSLSTTPCDFSSPDQLPAREAFAYDRLRSPVFVNSSYQLSSAKSVANPRTFFEDAMELIRIKEDLDSVPRPHNISQTMILPTAISQKAHFATPSFSSSSKTLSALAAPSPSEQPPEMKKKKSSSSSSFKRVLLTPKSSIIDLTFHLSKRQPFIDSQPLTTDALGAGKHEASSCNTPIPTPTLGTNFQNEPKKVSLWQTVLKLCCLGPT